MERYKLLPPLPKEPRGPPADIRNPRRHKPSASEPSASIRLNPAPPPKAHVKSNSDTSLGPGHGCRSNVSSSTTLVNGGMVPDHQRRARSQSCSQSRSRRARDALPEPEIDRAVGRKSVPESTMEAPIEELDSGVRCSTATELQGLWQAANGQRPEYGPKKFNLRFSRTDSSTFSLGDPQKPFYKMQTQTQGKRLSMARTNPSNPQRSTSIMDLELENRRRQGPNNDGLVTVLFSRLAALLAMEQAGEYATRKGLDSRAALEVEGNALRQAAEQESYHLNWNNDGRLYELQHASCPGVQSQPQSLIGAMGIPLSPIQQHHLNGGSINNSTLHITISTPSSTSPTTKQPPTIIVTNPIPLNSIEIETARQAATPRTSTLPHPAADDPLASLDLATMIFTVDIDAIMTMAPSVYAVDSVVAAVLAVAVADGQTRSVLDGLNVYNQEHPLTPFDVMFKSRSASDQDADTTMDADTGASTDTGAGTGTGTSKWSRLTNIHKAVKPRPKSKSTPDPKRNRKILIDEFSPVHHGCYGPGSSREGQSLPRATVRVIHGLYWALEVVVRGLTVVVRGVGRVVVEVTRGVTFLGGKLERKN